MSPNLRAAIAGIAAVSAIVSSSAVADEPTVGELRAAVAKSLPLLERGGDGHMAERKCFACHSQTMPVLAMVTARRRGFTVNDAHIAKHADFILASLEKGRERYADGSGQGGNVITAGHALWTLELAGRKANDTTAMVVEYLLTAHEKNVHWRVTTNRPPAEGSDFSATFVALRAVEHYGLPEQREQLGDRLLQVRSWLEATAAEDTEDRVFRLLALKQIGAEASLVRSAADELIAQQRDDGGWAQLADRESDAYATGTALVALHDAAGMSTIDPVYRRGLAFLLKTQHADGSWHVRSRSKPIQTYYDAGYPHEKDQFLSIAAAGWATTAVALACPTHVDPDP
jgi:hypothetical protein